MAIKPKYKTKQREALLEYLKETQGRHVTVSELCEHFVQAGSPIGQTTVYRHLEQMVQEGVVRKFFIDLNSPACFAFVCEDEKPAVENCFHAKCEKCGKLIHLHCEELKFLQEHLREHHRFELDPRRTVLYGVCEACQEQEASEAAEDSLQRNPDAC